MNTAVQFLTRCRGGALAAAIGLVFTGAAQSAFADAIPSPDGGWYNAATDAFTAASSGDLIASAVGYDDESFVFSHVTGTSVPEPALLLLFGAGLSFVAVRIRRRTLRAEPSAGKPASRSGGS